MCSDGSVPDKANCGADQVCKSPQDRCPSDTALYSLSAVDVPIAQGVGEFCLNAGVGIQLGAGLVVQIGVDAAVVGGMLRFAASCLLFPCIVASCRACGVRPACVYMFMQPQLCVGLPWLPRSADVCTVWVQALDFFESACATSCVW